MRLTSLNILAEVAMYVIANRRTGQPVTSCLDRARAEQLCRGHEALSIRHDLGARDHYWYVGRIPWGGVHPYDEGAARWLAAERDALIERHPDTTKGPLPQP
jgi:hypothetical protein